MGTEILWALNDVTVDLGESSSADITVVAGQPVFIGTDADGNTQRAVDITDISAHGAVGIVRTATENIAYTNGKITVALFPVRIRTDNVAAAALPTATADNLVYLNNSGEWCNADGNTAGHAYGSCVKVIAAGTYPASTTALYELDIKGRMTTS